LFQDRNEARRTIDDLKRIGVREGDVSLLSNEGVNGPISAYLDPATATREPQRILNALMRMGLSQVEAQRYVDGIQQGCTLETVNIEDARANDALEIMRAHALGPGAPAQRGIRGGTERSTTRGGAEEEVLPVIVEEVAVGKREVAAGRVRATSTTQSAPFEEDIELRTENVDVERRTVDRPIQPGDADAFRDRQVEVTATSEEPVVEKTAKVVEEVVVTKGVDTRTEKIRDTVRRTDVNIERIPYDASAYRSHYNSEYGKTGAKFDEYEPAYRFGHERGSTEESSDDWSNVEPKARTEWETKHPNTWERFKGAIRHAWERTTG